MGCQHRSLELERRQKAADPRIKGRETLPRDWLRDWLGKAERKLLQLHLSNPLRTEASRITKSHSSEGQTHHTAFAVATPGSRQPQNSTLYFSLLIYPQNKKLKGETRTRQVARLLA